VLKDKRLLWQLYPSYLLIILISLAAVSLFANTSIRKFYYEQAASDLENRALLLEGQISAHLSPLDREGMDVLCKELGRSGLTRVTVILPSGEVIGDSEQDPQAMDNHLDRPEVKQALTGGTGVSVRHSLTLGVNMMYVGVPLKENSVNIAVIRTSLPLTYIDKAIKGIQVKIIWGGVLVALYAALVGWFVARRISHPIDAIRKGAERYAQGDFGHRLPLADIEEIDSLAGAMNEMAASFQTQINTISRQRKELETILTGMVEGVVALDREERIINLNRAAAEMFGTNPELARGRRVQEVVRNVDFQKFTAKALVSDTLVEEDITLHTNGERIINGHSTVLRDEEGKSIGALVVLNDVTRLRKLENIRRDFVANVSHEIKTPLTAVKGFVETLRDGAMNNPEDARRFLDIIDRHASRLEAIVDDLLSLSRLEQEVEKDEVVLSEIPIRNVLTAANQICEVKAASKNIKILFSGNEELKARINPPLLEQAIVNLLDNAIKYSESAGTVRVEAEHQGDEIVISVRDHGRGIEKEHLDRLFERFYRVDKARSRKLGGTGLGLAIVKHIAQAHGGYVSVDSALGEGSTFRLHLPAI